MLQLWLLGQFDVRVDGKRAVIASRAAQSLLGFLSLNPGIPHRREKLAGMLWPEMPDENARSNLRHELWRVRKAITSPQSLASPRSDYILTEELTIAFNADFDYWLDAAQLEHSLPANATLDQRISQVSMYQGELLPGFYDDWVLLERERFQAVFETRIRALLEELIREQHWTSVVKWAEKWIAFGQTPEAAYRALILTYAMLGDRARCIAAYERCRRTLQEELGVEPSEETRALYQELLRGDLIASVSLSAPRVHVGKKSALYDEPPAPGEPPFKGLQYFDERDADLFFGRELLTAKIAGRLRESRFLAVVIGASGSGKSSVVRAGVIPSFKGNSQTSLGGNKGNHVTEGTSWRIHVITPTAHPLLALATELTRDVESVTATATLLDDFAREPRALYLFLRRQSAEHGEQKETQSSVLIPHTLLVIDQFEELFTLCHDDLEREQFVDNLLTAISEEARGLVTLILTLRADFYAHLAQYPELRDAVARNQEYIGPMTVEELRRAIQEPAKQRVAADGQPWEFEPGLVDLLLRDVGDEPGALPLLSHALLETWKRRSGHTMTLKGYHDAGGVRGAIAQTAETTYQSLMPEQQTIAHNIFLRLTELGEGTEDTRRRASFNELIPRDENAAVVHGVLIQLADARLITTSANSAEVAHEALIREWGRLREWLNADREGLRLHRQLTDAAHEWELLEHDAGAFYRGARLAQAKEFVQANPHVLNEEERAFLDASVENEMREEREREEARQRELLAKEKLLEAETLRVGQEQAANRRLRQRAVFLMGAFVLALVLAGIALYLGNEARSSALAAQKQQRLAAARELAASAISNLNVDPERSILLATRAISTTYAIDKTWTVEAEDALRRALEASRIELDLRGHTNEVWAVAFSPDGSRVATASDDGTAKVWDAVTGQLLLTIPTDATLSAHGIDFSPDGKNIATASRVGTAKVWDAATGQELVTLSSHADWVADVAFSPDGKRLATASEDRTAKVWDAITGEEIFTLGGHAFKLWDVAFSRDGARIATGSADFKAMIWDAKTGQELLTLEGHTASVFGVAFSPDGTRLATASLDGTAKLWDAVSGSELLTLLAPADLVTRVAFSPDGKRLVTSSSDGKARVWDSNTGKELLTLGGHTGPLVGAAFNFDGTRLATASADGTAKVWNVSPGKELLALFIPNISARAVNPIGSYLAVGYLDGTIQVWDISTTLQGAALGKSTGAVIGRELASWRGHEGTVNALTFSPDGTRLATAGNDRTAKVWDVATGNLVRTMVGHQDWVMAVTFSPDGKRLATTSKDRTTKVWDFDAAAGQARFTFTLPNWGWPVGFSPDGTRVAAGNHDGTARIWDVTTGNELLMLRGHGGEVWGIAFSPDGTRLATASEDRTAKVWDVATGKELLTLRGHSGPVNAAVFSVDGKKIATASEDGLVKLWDALAGQEMVNLIGHTDAVWDAAFSADGTRLVTFSQKGEVRFYLLHIQDLLALAQTRTTRTLTGSECQNYLHLPQEQCPAQELALSSPTTPGGSIFTQSAQANGKICEVTDLTGVRDQFFNEITFRGMQAAGARFDWQVAAFEPRKQEDYAATVEQATKLGCDLIVTPRGLEFADIVDMVAQANPKQKFQIMEWAFDQPLDNVWAQVYAIDQAGFLGGYVAASVTKTGKVGTFGGVAIPPVTLFMDGFALGVRHYNEKNGTHVEVLGWDPAKQEGLFAGSFDNTDDGHQIGERLLNDGADIILPVAGYTSLGTATAVKEHGNAYLIGVDSDWAETFPEYANITLTSIEKRLDVSVQSAVQAIVEGNFTGGTHIGTLENGGVGIAPFHDLDILVSPQVKADLQQIRADIIAGKIKTKP